MLRLLLILIAFVVLLRLLGWRPPWERRASGEQAPAQAAAEDLVQCAACRLRLPRAQALLHQDRWYCSPGHRD